MKKEKVAPAETTAQGEAQVVEEESKGKRILNSIVNTLLIIAIILAAMCTYVSYVSTSGSGVPSILGIQMYSIQTDSMYPTLLPGDLIFGNSIDDPSELRKGDIITYWTVINGERVLNTHTIHEIYDGGGYLIFATKGDNNTAVDALTVHESEIVSKYSFRVPGVGKVFDYLQTSTGFLIVVVVPVFLFFLYHLVQFFRVLFEYQNVKNRIKYEQERGRTEDLILEQQQKQQEQQARARAAMEAELREKLRAELLAGMGAQGQPAVPAQPQPAVQPVVAETPAPAPATQPVAETPVQTETAPAVQAAPVAEPVAQTAPVVAETPAPAAQPAAETAPVQPEAAPVTQAAPVAEPVAQTAPAVTETPAPAVDDAAKAATEAAVAEALAQAKAAMEAELREKLRAEFMASMAAQNQSAAPAPEAAAPVTEAPAAPAESVAPVTEAPAGSAESAAPAQSVPAAEGTSAQSAETAKSE